MTEYKYEYIVIGGGVAGVSAVRGIREIDKNGSILLVSDEGYLPYQRPALSKNLWLSSKTISDFFIQKQQYFDSMRCEVKLGIHITSVFPEAGTVADEQGIRYSYGTLLIATGAVPRRLTIPGGDCEEVFYFRKYDDFMRLSRRLEPGRSITVIGGGFIGTEITATFARKGMHPTMLFPEAWPCAQLFPEDLGRKMLDTYRERGVTVVPGDKGACIAKENGFLVIHTENGREMRSDFIVVGIGSIPAVDLAESAGLATANGILVDAFLRSSHPSIYAAGDDAAFCDQGKQCTRRVEHWQNAMRQGRIAGRNMAGAREPYIHQSFFFSEIFDFSYKVVGDASSSQRTVSDWRVDFSQGVIYYLTQDRVTGIMLCNCPEKLEPARALLQRNEAIAPESLKGML